MAKIIYKNYSIISNPNWDKEDPASDAFLWIEQMFDYDAGKTYHTLKPFPEIPEEEGYPKYEEDFNCYSLTFADDSQQFAHPGDIIEENYCIIELYHKSSQIYLESTTPGVENEKWVKGPQCTSIFKNLRGFKYGSTQGFSDVLVPGVTYIEPDNPDNPSEEDYNPPFTDLDQDGVPDEEGGTNWGEPEEEQQYETEWNSEDFISLFSNESNYNNIQLFSSTTYRDKNGTGNIIPQNLILLPEPSQDIFSWIAPVRWHYASSENKTEYPLNGFGYLLHGWNDLDDDFYYNPDNEPSPQQILCPNEVKNINYIIDDWSDIDRGGYTIRYNSIGEAETLTQAFRATIECSAIQRYHTKFYHTNWEYQQISLPIETYSDELGKMDEETSYWKNIDNQIIYYFNKSTKFDADSFHQIPFTWCYRIQPLPQTIYAIFRPNYFLSHWQNKDDKAHKILNEDRSNKSSYREYTQNKQDAGKKFEPVYTPHTYFFYYSNDNKKYQKSYNINLPPIPKQEYDFPGIGEFRLTSVDLKYKSESNYNALKTGIYLKYPNNKGYILYEEYHKIRDISLPYCASTNYGVYYGWQQERVTENNLVPFGDIISVNNYEGNVFFKAKGISYDQMREQNLSIITYSLGNGKYLLPTIFNEGYIEVPEFPSGITGIYCWHDKTYNGYYYPGDKIYNTRSHYNFEAITESFKQSNQRLVITYNDQNYNFYPVLQDQTFYDSEKEWYEIGSKEKVTLPITSLSEDILLLPYPTAYVTKGTLITDIEEILEEEKYDINEILATYGPNEPISYNGCTHGESFQLVPHWTRELPYTLNFIFEQYDKENKTFENSGVNASMHVLYQNLNSFSLPDLSTYPKRETQEFIGWKTNVGTNTYLHAPGAQLNLGTDLDPHGLHNIYSFNENEETPTITINFYPVYANKFTFAPNDDWEYSSGTMPNEILFIPNADNFLPGFGFFEDVDKQNEFEKIKSYGKKTLPITLPIKQNDNYLELFAGWKLDNYDFIIQDGGDISHLPDGGYFTPIWIISKSKVIYWQFAPNKWYPVSNIKIKDENGNWIPFSKLKTRTNLQEGWK